MSYRSVLNVTNGEPSNPKLTLKINSLRIKCKAQNFASWMLSEYAFKIGRKKRKLFFDHSTTLSAYNSKTNSVTPIFYYRIVLSMIRCNFLQSLKNYAKGVQSHRKFQNLRWLWIPFAEFFKLCKKLHLIMLSTIQ